MNLTGEPQPFYADAGPPSGRLAGVPRSWPPPYSPHRSRLPPLLERRSARPPLDPMCYTALCLLDDLAYGAGVWIGCARERSLAALRPAFTGPLPAPQRVATPLTKQERATTTAVGRPGPGFGDRSGAEVVAVNHFATAVLLESLGPQLAATGGAAVVAVGSNRGRDDPSAARRARRGVPRRAGP